MARPAALSPALYHQVRHGVFTDLSLEDMVHLAQVASDTPCEAIQAEVLDYDYVSSYRTPAGASVLVLKYGEVIPFIHRLFHTDSGR